MKATKTNQASRRDDLCGISGAQVISCLLCLTLFTIVTTARPAPQGKRTDQENPDQLEIKLSTHTPRICLNAALPLVMEVTNTSQQEIKIHKSDLWSRFNYSSPGGEFAGSSISCGFWDNQEKDWVVSAPGAKYFDTFIYMTEGSYFKTAGTYRISTTLSYHIGDKHVGYIKSNEAEFEIYDCAAK